MKASDTPNRPDSMLIEPKHIVSARRRIGEQGNPVSFEDLAQREPALATYIHESMAALAGKMTLSGAPTELVQGMYQETMTLLLSSVEAQRRGHYSLWRGTIVGTKLEEIDPKVKRARKKPKEQDGE